jgi:serine/threonine protein kinase
MSTSFEGYECEYDEDGSLVAEKIRTIYTNYSTHMQHKVTVAWKLNENTPKCLENHLLRRPEYTNWQQKKDVVLPLTLNEFDSGLHRVWETVTGFEFRTDNGKLSWTSFEDEEEIIVRLPLENIPAHVPKIDFSLLSARRHLDGPISTVKYQRRTCVLKSHISAIQNDIFPAEVDARIKLGNVAHVTPMLGVVVKDSKVDRTPQVTGILLKYGGKGDLRRILRTEKIKRTIRERWAAQIIHGLDAIHNAGLIHGDLKCRNVVVDGRNNAQIIDLCDGYGRTDGWFLETDDPRDPRRDIYSFGVTFWEILHDGQDPLSGRPADEPGTDWASRIIQRCVRQNPSDRPSLATVFDELGGRKKCGCDSVASKLGALWRRFK